MRKRIVLSGGQLTLKQVSEIARKNIEVEISDESMKRLKEARELIFRLADKGIPIYGFTVGVGWNKDKRVFS